MTDDISRFVEDLARIGQPFDCDPGPVFTMYGCGLYAAALRRQDPSLEFVAAGDAACSNEDCSDFGCGVCQCMTNHIYAFDGSWLYDIYGEHEPEAVAEFATLRALTDEVMLCVLESWYGFDGESADVAALAVYLTSTEDWGRVTLT